MAGWCRAASQLFGCLAEMAQDREHEQALQVTADSLLTEQLALQKRLQQLTLEYESEADVVQQLQSGEHVASAEHAGASTMYSNAVPGKPQAIQPVQFVYPCCMQKHTWCALDYVAAV